MAARGSYAKGLLKRDEILTVALSLFTEKGYGKVSMREIARESNLSQAGLLHHFPTKEQLFLEILRRRDDRDGDEVERAGHQGDHLVGVVERNAAEPELVRLFITMSAKSFDPDSGVREWFVERYQWLRTEVERDIRSLQARGELTPDLDVIEAASLLIAAADGLQVQWLLEPDCVDMGQRLRALWELLRTAGPASTETL